MKVAIVGATGETNQSIIAALLQRPEDFEITAYVRPASINKPEVQSAKDQGVAIVPFDLESPQEELVKALTGQDVLISCVIPFTPDAQMALADAAKVAGVKRFVPSAFGPSSPPKGTMALRDVKEDVLNHIKKIYLPYTVIDVGWWYQSTLPRLPSGKIDYALTFPMANMYGDGNFPSALTDLRDVGKYVARIIADPRTLNKSVFVYNEVWTQEQIFTLLEKASGEKIPREYLSKEEIEATIAAASKKFYNEEWSLPNLLGLVVVQYANSVWLRGDNVPESAEYLGYLSGKELYPDVETIKFEQYVAEVLAGNGKATYANRTFDFATKDGEDKK
ncbi:hypothetical protein BGZ61DRAFT_425721 [Ilyonectria robusta]|uniref:uncharacterized protein n=1 Tax=Ilyonectria robusta TaxID=1079257 RepID=UPI001E8CC079|nr:uncharacterized protein BGZ61DRAFT_425721 [Ilyonectria robusta]KAH8679129.1 hypothetical protein BGZ61DRAFT_425721 [Ilyonectria robusta]